MKTIFTPFINLLFFFLLLTTVATAQPTSAPISAQPSLFTYFTPLSPDMPEGSNMASKAIVLLNRGFPYPEMYGNEWLRGADGTAFFIRTFLDNTSDANKLCICMTGHQIANLFPDGTTPTIGSNLLLYTDIYMGYLGQAITDSRGNSINRTTNFSKSYLASAKLLEYFKEGTSKDIALLLVDKRDLPSAWIGTLGYDFDDDNSSWIGNAFYTLAHPHYYPQRLTNNETVTNNATNFVQLSSSAPYAGGSVGSGAPLVISSATTGTTPIVKGVVSGGVDNLWFNDLNGIRYYYGFNSNATKIKALEQAIRQNCWNKRDSFNISVGGLYRISAVKDNQSTTNAYSQNVSLNNASSLVGSATSAYTETTEDLEVTHLHGNICTIGDFTLPVNHPTSSKPWQVAIACKEIDVSTDFTYTASGESELNLSSVVIDAETSPSSRQTDSTVKLITTTNLETENRLSVYPNPSNTGVFNITVQLKGSNTQQNYTLQMLSADGKIIYQTTGQSGMQHTVDIHQYATGFYFVTVRDNKGNILQRATVAYGN
ncbi:T9SS type A sorting domain-containing protein [Taibaiella soli]|uniref:Secretion system C-terminal sorting domain-containing protein n=1 Tax=Taibaiella soli TaxID=1649169 RepID=A0A2W2B5E9_9BACT|nr:T9SS type A sorting domain-containing protein [Taibaiella soli]PZF71419.1 hypothetical protein DN068_19210 [Taibaiella soli]